MTLPKIVGKVTLPKPIVRKTYEEGFEEGSKRWETLGDSAYFPTFPTSDYDKGINEGFNYSRALELQEYANK